MSDDDLQARLEMLSRLLGRSVTLRERSPARDDDMVNTTPEQVAGEQNSSSKSHSASAQDQPIDLAEEILDYSTFQIGKPVDTNVDFCPWNLIVSYPSRYIGKTNKPLAQPFFDKILEGRVWDFFYIHDVARPMDKPFLLVPTIQFEDFLRFVNRALGIALHIPNGVNQEKFFLKFGNGGTPQPRYLQRSRDNKSLKIENWPVMDTDDALAFKQSSLASQNKWTETLKMIPSGVVFDKRADSKQKAVRRAEDRARMLREAQQLLGLSKDGLTEDAVFICVDIEAIERAPNPISEIGFAILDIEAIRDVAPGLYDENWWPMIQAFHLRVKEYAGLVNSEFVHGCPDAFDFGSSTFPRKADVPEAIMSILAPYTEANRSLIIAGHDVKQDLNYLSDMGIEITKLGGIRSIVDSQVMHQAWRSDDRGRSLKDILGDLGIASKHLHNAGNDAVYTLRAVVGIAIRQSCEQVVEEPEVQEPKLSEAHF